MLCASRTNHATYVKNYWCNIPFRLSFVIVELYLSDSLRSFDSETLRAVSCFLYFSVLPFFSNPDLPPVLCHTTWFAAAVPPLQERWFCENATTRVWFTSYDQISNFTINVSRRVLEPKWVMHIRNLLEAVLIFDTGLDRVRNTVKCRSLLPSIWHSPVPKVMTVILRPWNAIKRPTQRWRRRSITSSHDGQICSILTYKALHYQWQIE